MIDGEIIKARRKEIGMSQIKLAENICTQGIVSKIERNDLVPSEELISKIAKKLDLKIEDIKLNKAKKLYKKEVEILENLVLQFLRKKEYQTLSSLVSQNKYLISEVSQSNDYYRRFFKWVEAQMLYHLQGNPKKAIEMLNNIIKEGLSGRIEVNCLISLATMHYVLQENDKSIEIYRKIEAKIKGIDDFYTKVKFLYNYALALTRVEKYIKALEKCTRAIDILLDKQSLYLLGYLYYEIGYIYSDLNKSEEANESYNIALTIFKMQNNTKMIAMTKLEFKSLSKGTHRKDEKEGLEYEDRA